MLQFSLVADIPRGLLLSVFDNFKTISLVDTLNNDRSKIPQSIMHVGQEGNYVEKLIFTMKNKVCQCLNGKKCHRKKKGEFFVIL